MAVVRWHCAEDRPQHRDTRFFIHSSNIAAASLMVECLLRNGYTAEFRPFGFDLVDLLSFEGDPPDVVLKAARSRRYRSWHVRFRVFTHRLKRIRRLFPSAWL
jgi:hypothetical protein